ncbi:MAG: hypothetical protein H0X66_20960 [Verrucomicrobia bacterium]|nr:hypothetical protein [Verrucomicrobiota bacterium]
MALKFKFTTREEIPAEQQSLYIERDGTWVLDAEGVVEKSKLDEIRNNQTALIKERDEIKKRFEGIDPDEVRRLAEEKEKLELQAKGHKPEEIEKVVEGRLKNAKSEWDKQFTAVTAERDALNARLTAIQIDQGVTTVATKRGLRPTAIPDISARARNVFRLVNGVPTAFEADGKTVRYGKDGITPMTIDEWIDSQVAEAPHLFESNAGGGSGSSAAAPGGAIRQGMKNPFKRETWNLTEQMKLQKSDPGLAARLKAAAN